MSGGSASVLTAHPFFSQEGGSEAGILRAAAREVVFEQGDVIFEAGSASDGLYLVVDGTVAFQALRGDDKPRTVSRASGGEFFGEVGVLTGQSRSLRAVAETRCGLAHIPSAALEEYLHAIPGPVEKLVYSLVRHLHDTTHHYLADMVRQEKMAMVGTMMNTIIHDFKNPFCMISLGAQMMGAVHSDPQTRRICKTIEEQVQRMVDMATEIGDFSRGQANYVFQPTNLRALLERFRELNFPFFERPGVRIDIDVPDVTFDAEPQRMLRVFQNLVGNALEALPEGRGEVSIRASLESDELVVRVRDTGGGIPPEVQERFWEPFVTHGKRNGTGLGTAIVKSIVEGHHGTISFETHPGKGTTFTIHLPRRQMK